MPILNYEHDIVGVAQIMNKEDGGNFTVADEKVIIASYAISICIADFIII